MNQKRDYYEILGIARAASPEDIKKAYRRLAHRHHPDKNPGDRSAEERFKEISEAYEILGNPEKRQAYDQFGTAGPGRGFEGFGGFESGLGSIFDDIFEGFFGGRTDRSGRGAQRGADLRYNMEIRFEEAALGVEKEIIVPRLETCHVCRGSGARAGSQPVVCRACRGTGQLRFSQGFLTVSQTCGQCRGEGRVVDHPCPNCKGLGQVKAERTLTVKIPAGVETGTRLKLAGEGEAGVRGGPPGDLYVVITVQEHPIFARHGDDLTCEVPISFSQAALGAQIEIPTISGRATLKVPPGSQTGTEFRMKGKGFPNLRGYGRGDLIARIFVEVPAHLTAKQRDLLEQYARLENGAGSPLVQGFWEKVKALFD
ncbi:MAG: molecular chaperone DnaJ [candidate division NC10 bacterium]|nr:molecular chaperone DnaJ [candidate division NC10 bacterium]